eukprot:2502716-Pleurochrysis_carterae.AAC.2
MSAIISSFNKYTRVAIGWRTLMKGCYEVLDHCWLGRACEDMASRADIETTCGGAGFQEIHLFRNGLRVGTRFAPSFYGPDVHLDAC